jgi:hypothetical protein
MLHWVESQSILVITLLVFGFCYVLTIATFGAAAILSRRAVARELKAASPVTLTPLAVILALLLVFLSSRVWTNLDRAGEYVGQEASALREALLLADTLPSDVRKNVRESIKRHLHFIETQDWPAMGRVQATLQAIPAGLTDAMAAVLSFTPAQPTQQLAQERTVMAIEQAFEARQNRIRLSQLQIAPHDADPGDDRNDTYRQSTGDGGDLVHLFDSGRGVPGPSHGLRPTVCRRRRYDDTDSVSRDRGGLIPFTLDEQNSRAPTFMTICCTIEELYRGLAAGGFLNASRCCTSNCTRGPLQASILYSSAHRLALRITNVSSRITTLLVCVQKKLTRLGQLWSSHVLL